MAAVFLVPVNTAFARSMLGANQDIGIIFVTLPTANILLLAAPRAWSDIATRAFQIGFEVAGWFMVVFLGSNHHALRRDIAGLFAMSPFFPREGEPKVHR
jgi:hypothetical protein